MGLAGPRHSHSSPRTVLLLAALLLPLAAGAQSKGNLSGSAVPAAPQAQESEWRYDGALSGFAQITGATNGNSIREDTSESLGGLASFRHPYRPWLGYEVNYGFTRYSEFYNKGVTTVQNNVQQFSAAYLFQSPKPMFYRLEPFATIGFGVLIFSPSHVTNASVSTQLLPAFVYSIGVNRPVTSRLGVRIQFRGLDYKTPSYNQLSLDTYRLRTTMEPTIGVYYRF